MPPKRRADPLQQSLFPADVRIDPAPQKISRLYDHSHLLLGTCAFNAAGWAGSFYPPGMKPAQ